MSARPLRLGAYVLPGDPVWLRSSLERTTFLDTGNPRRIMERLRRLFGKARLESQEVNVLRGMLNAWDEAIEERRGRGPGPPGD